MLLHGLGATTVEVERLGQYLHASGLSIFAPNVEGFCYGTPASDWMQWVELGIGDVRNLKKQYASVCLVGISMGATLALAIAQKEQVDGLVLLAPALAYDGWAIPWYAFLLDMLPIVPFKHRYRYKEAEPYGVKNPGMRAQIKKALASGRVSEAGGDSISLSHVDQGRRLIRHVRQHIGQVTAPTLILHAVEDETVAVRNAEWVFEHIASPKKDIVYLGDCYHMITVDNERETVMQETERFLKRTLNEKFAAPEFEVPPVLSRELRRLLRSTS